MAVDVHTTAYIGIAMPSQGNNHISPNGLISLSTLSVCIAESNEGNLALQLIVFI